MLQRGPDFHFEISSYSHICILCNEHYAYVQVVWGKGRNTDERSLGVTALNILIRQYVIGQYV